MGYWIKIGDTWNLVLTSYKKDLSIWDEINQANLTQYLNTNLSFFSQLVNAILRAFAKDAIKATAGVPGCSSLDLLDT